MSKRDIIIHESTALMDDKIQALITEKGAASYAVYWACVEFMTQNDGYLNRSSLKVVSRLLSSKLTFVQSCFDLSLSLGLFRETSNHEFYSERLIESLDKAKQKRLTLQRNINKRWNKEEEYNGNTNEDTNVLQKNYKCSSSDLSSYSYSSSCSSSCSKIDKENLLSNDKEMKEKNGSLACDAQLDSSTPTTRKKSRRRSERCQIPTLEEVTSYAESIGSKIDPEEFIVFYNSKNWKVGKDVMTDWHSAVRGWEIRRKKAEKAKAEAEAKRAEAESKKRTAGYISDFVPATQEELNDF